jgi:hypothetical protein
MNTAPLQGNVVRGTGTQPCVPTPTTAHPCARTSASSAARGTLRVNGNVNELAASLIPTAKNRAAYYASLLGCDFDDALSDALLGLTVALQQWDGTRGASLDTYARHKMNGYIRHGIRDRSWQKNCKPLPRTLISWEDVDE